MTKCPKCWHLEEGDHRKIRAYSLVLGSFEPKLMFTVTLLYMTRLGQTEAEGLSGLPRSGFSLSFDSEVDIPLFMEV